MLFVPLWKIPQRSCIDDYFVPLWKIPQGSIDICAEISEKHHNRQNRHHLLCTSVKKIPQQEEWCIDIVYVPLQKTPQHAGQCIDTAIVHYVPL